MSYSSLHECILDLEKKGELLRIKEEVDPYMEMAAIHLRIHEKGGPAILFERVKGTKYNCVSNLFGTLERSQYVFRNSFSQVQHLIHVKNNPANIFNHFFQSLALLKTAFHAWPLKNPLQKPILFEEIKISDLPQIHHWQQDGGAFITLPQVYSEDIENPGVFNANLGMYRIQLSGNEYKQNQEVGLHYQLHRGIGVHQSKAKLKGEPLKISIFVGGPPAHSVAAVMPLPENMSELTFAGALASRRFRYFYKDGYCISSDADFVITGEVNDEVKPEGPFGDHLGYYSLTHPFPVMKVHKVYAKKNAIWPFTVVGRPPQEDTAFGQLIHKLTGSALQKEIPGLKEIHAVDAAGVHPLLLAIGSERYTPYNQTKQPAELLTIANHILGKGQLSLAKFLLITANHQDQLDTHDIPAFFQYILERIHLHRDIHFYTHTSIDTLDYSGHALNQGSKVVLAAYGEKIRTLSTEIPSVLANYKTQIIIPGIIALQWQTFTTYEQEAEAIAELIKNWRKEDFENIPLIVLCDDVDFCKNSFSNFLWVSFTRCNPAMDMYGINANTIYKHWACDALIMDSRSKPHHAPPLLKNVEVEKRVDEILTRAAIKF
ncbi:MAG: UbiD family decarboxylase [Chitinophagaceae bacterium]